ncbi:MAG: prolipoprotein diacylglyceryl transferase [Candidatus Doudnabacteria bacterium]
MAGTSAKNRSAKTGSTVLNPKLSQSFAIGFLNIRLYSLTFVGGIMAAYVIAQKRIQKSEISAEVFENIVFWTILWGFISARIYYVLFYWNQYKNNLSEIFMVWHGGLAIYGGLIGGALTIFILCKKNNVKFFRFTDLIILGIPLGQAIGRMGNYFNKEAFGLPTNLPWKIYIPLANRPQGYAQYSYFHPTFLYEIIADLLIFFILFRYIRKSTLKPYPMGFLTALYLFLYSIARFAIEDIRLDSAYFGPFKGDQLTAAVLILTSAIVMVYLYKFRYNNARYVT